MKKYQPIACSLYDYFELLIIKKQRVLITTEDSKIQTVLVNIYTKESIEYTELENGSILRLDDIKKIDNLSTGEFISCKI